MNATARNQDVVWSFCDFESSCAIALKLEWTPIQLNSSNHVITEIFRVKFPYTQISRILDIARNIVLQTLVHVFACMLENAVLNVFLAVASLLTRDITRDGGVYRLWFLGCRTIRTPSVLCCGTPGTPLIFEPTASAMTRTEAPSSDAQEGRAGLDVSVIAIASPPLPTGIAKLLTGRPSEGVLSQVRPVLRCLAEEAAD